MSKRYLTAPLAFALALGGCATNYAGEGAIAGGAAGAVIGADDGDIGEGALIGAAIGALGGTLIKKKDRSNCERVDRDGRRYRVPGC
ncbi:MAG: hypothetical protein KDE55_10410 [Novosphingobium sp.]|nr:hypothetical protein [Novosphingobium sp.]